MHDLVVDRAVRDEVVGVRNEAAVVFIDADDLALRGNFQTDGLFAVDKEDVLRRSDAAERGNGLQSVLDGSALQTQAKGDMEGEL